MRQSYCGKVEGSAMSVNGKQGYGAESDMGPVAADDSTNNEHLSTESSASWFDQIFDGVSSGDHQARVDPRSTKPESPADDAMRKLTELFNSLAKQH
jgi:hypothetical protein